MDPNTTSSFQNTQSKLVFAEQTIDSSVIQRSNLQLRTVTEPKVERTCNANITETKQILERKPVSGDTLTTVQDQLMVINYLHVMSWFLNNLFLVIFAVVLNIYILVK